MATTLVMEQDDFRERVVSLMRHQKVIAIVTGVAVAITVLLAAALLHERTTVLQRFGLGTAAVAIVLITV